MKPTPKNRHEGTTPGAQDLKGIESYWIEDVARQTGISRRTLERWAAPDARGRVFFAPSLAGGEYSADDLEALKNMVAFPPCKERDAATASMHGHWDLGWLRLVADQLRAWHGYSSNNEVFLRCRLDWDGYDYWELLPTGERRSCLRRPGAIRPAGGTHVPPTSDPTLTEIVDWYIREFLIGKKRKGLIKATTSSLNQFARIHGDLRLSQVDEALLKRYPKERRARAGKREADLARSAKGELKDIKTAIRRWELRGGCTTSEAVKETGFSRRMLEGFRDSGVFTPSLQVKGFGGRATRAYSKSGPDSDIEILRRLRQLGSSDLVGRLIREAGGFLRNYRSYPSITEALRHCELTFNGYDLLHMLPSGERLSCRRRPGRKIPVQGTRPQTWGDFIMDVYEQEFLAKRDSGTQTYERLTIDNYILPVLGAVPMSDVGAFQAVLAAARILKSEFPAASPNTNPRGNLPGVLGHISKAATSRGLLPPMPLANNRVKLSQAVPESPVTSQLRALYRESAATAAKPLREELAAAMAVSGDTQAPSVSRAVVPEVHLWFNPEVFPDLLKLAMACSCLTQGEVADKLGCDESMVRRYLAGRALPRNAKRKKKVLKFLRDWLPSAQRS